MRRIFYCSPSSLCKHNKEQDLYMLATMIWLIKIFLFVSLLKPLSKNIWFTDWKPALKALEGGRRLLNYFCSYQQEENFTKTVFRVTIYLQEQTAHLNHSPNSSVWNPQEKCIRQDKKSYFIPLRVERKTNGVMICSVPPVL